MQRSGARQVHLHQRLLVELVDARVALAHIHRIGLAHRARGLVHDQAPPGARDRLQDGGQVERLERGERAAKRFGVEEFFAKPLAKERGRDRAFTLVELLVVIAIIGLLVAMPLLQLVPLPAEWWAALPGREPYLRALEREPRNPFALNNLGAALRELDLDCLGWRMVPTDNKTLGVTAITGEIVASSQEQSSGLQQVNTAVAQMDQVTQQNVSLVTQSAASARALDEQARIRMDDWELREDVQQTCRDLWPSITTENLSDLTDYTGYKQEFLRLFGFGLAEVDYEADVNPDVKFDVVEL